jgi:diadenosine tetraphosphate (Ap4A) HIT family hydrolase
VLPSLGQIVEGYLLIMPKGHYRSFALLDEELFEEAESVYSETEAILRRTYTRPIFYEHGMGYSASGNGCCVDHAHIHAIPVSLSLFARLEQEFEWSNIQKLEDLSRMVKGTHYLFVQDSSQQKRVYYASNVKAQYIRHIVAEQLGTPDKGDWMLYPGVEEVLNTIRRLSLWRPRQKEPESRPVMTYNG